MKDDSFGASPQEWQHFAYTLGLENDLLPTVANPHAEISPLSKVKKVGKVPMLYNFKRQAIGMPDWTSYIATERDIIRWQAEADYGIALQCRQIRALDIDVPNAEGAAAIVAFVDEMLGYKLPRRMRSNSGKVLLPFRYPLALTKHVIPVEWGIIEVLADGQQFIAAGQHESGVRYEWEGGLPAEIPTLDELDLEMLLGGIIGRFHKPEHGKVKVARTKRNSVVAKPEAYGGQTDDVADWLQANWEVYDVEDGGRLFIECPFAGEHTVDSGPSATAYYPANTGGFERGHFVCLHGHCTGRGDADFLDACGYSIAQFDDLGPEEPVPGAAVVEPSRIRERMDEPRFVRSERTGKIDASGKHLTLALAYPPIAGVVLAYDRFKDQIMWCPPADAIGHEAWRPFGDTDYMRVRIALETKGFGPIGKDLLREAVAWVAQEQAIDTAQVWLSRLEWDGVPRVETFLSDCMGVADTPYARAVSCYIWTAHAGRVIEPGVKADMVPIYYGRQGAMKSTAIAAMSPAEDFFVKLDMGNDDDKLARLMRGKLVGELEELRGFKTRDSDAIKAWVSRQWEEWIPKFKEFGTKFPRRLILHASTNDAEFLADDTGERRYLPMEVAGVQPINVARIKTGRDQLWAEGADLFLTSGVAWQDAERLAEGEHARFKDIDEWAPAVRRWLDEEGVDGVVPRTQFITSIAVATGACGVALKDVNPYVGRRIAKILKSEGFVLVKTKHERGFRHIARPDVP